MKFPSILICAAAGAVTLTACGNDSDEDVAVDRNVPSATTDMSSTQLAPTPPVTTPDTSTPIPGTTTTDPTYGQDTTTTSPATPPT